MKCLKFIPIMLVLILGIVEAQHYSDHCPEKTFEVGEVNYAKYIFNSYCKKVKKNDQSAQNKCWLNRFNMFAQNSLPNGEKCLTKPHGLCKYRNVDSQARNAAQCCLVRAFRVQVPNNGERETWKEQLASYFLSITRNECDEEIIKD